MELAEKIQSPVAVINAAKAVIDETFPHYLGIYMGKASEPHVREAIETSDCLLAIGYRPIEVTTGDFSASLPANTIHARGHSMDVGDDNYQAVTLREVLKGVTDAVPQVRNRAPRHVTPGAAMAAAQAGGPAKLTQAAYWRTIQGYLRPGDVLFVDNGTSYALFGLRFPPKCTFVGSVNWGSIGYSVGALLGTLTAAPDRRHLLFVGDGSFQVTAQELSTILRHDQKPVIFLINNGGYTIERGYLGKSEPYNDIANWAYADLPKVFCRETSARSFVVKTERDLRDALNAPNDTMIFVESIMDPHDALAPVTNSSNMGADLNYGPRGPQHRENLQLRPATQGG
jgi:indolepyruvate decarboxylase